MKRIALLLLLAISAVITKAQGVTTALTAYQQFQPATIYLSSGKLLEVGLANIFLKNSSLIYKSGYETKEANMKTLTKVAFKDRTYYRIDTVLAYQVDPASRQQLYCAQRLDIEAWKKQLVNNRNMTNISLGDLVSYTTIDLADAQDIHFPLVKVYYFKIDGRYVLAHERHLKRVLDKERRRLMASVMAEEGFSWTKEDSLLKLLQYIQ